MRIICLITSSFLSALLIVSTTHAITFEEADNALNKAYQTAMQSIDPSDQQRLQKLQRQWIQYRDQACELRVKALKETAGHCKASLTVEQTYFLTLLSAQKFADKEFYATLFSDQFASQLEHYRHYLSNRNLTFIQVIDQLLDDRYLTAYQALPKSSQKTLSSSYGLWRDLTEDLCNLIDSHSEIGVQFCIGSRALQQVNLLTLLTSSKG